MILSSADFEKKNQKNISGIQSECQTVLDPEPALRFVLLEWALNLFAKVSAHG